MQKALNLFKQHKDKFLIAKISSLQVIVSFVTNLIILRKVGLGAELDVFYIAMAVFFFLCASINWSVASVLVPYLVKNRGQNKEGSLFVTVTILTTPVAILMYFSTPLWLAHLYSNYLSSVPYADILFIQKVFLVTYIVESVSLTFSAIVQEKGRYVWFNGSLLLSSVLGLAFVSITIDQLGIYAAAWSQLLMKTLLCLSLMALGFKQVINNIQFDKSQLVEIFKRSRYILLGSIYFKTDELVERYIASYLTSGFISLLAFIQRIYSAMVTVINAAIGTPSITSFSNLISAGNYSLVKTALYKYLILLLTFSVFVFIFMWFLGEEIFTWLIGSSLTDDLADILPVSILCMCTFLLAKTVSQVNQSLLLALEKGSIATLYDSITFTVNVAIKIYATYTWGMHGLLVSLVISYTLTELAKFSLVIKELNRKLSPQQ